MADNWDWAAPTGGGGGGGTPAVPEVLYEDTTSQSYAQDAWINLTGIRELVEADDNSIIELAFRVVGQDLWEVFELSADLLRARPFNTSSNATSPGFRFKTGRSESNLSGFGHSMAFLSRRDATTWRVGQAHVWFDRIRIELLPDGGGGSGTKVVANPGGTGLVDLGTVSIDGVGYNIAGGGSAFNLAALYGVIGGNAAVGKVIKYVSSTAAAWADDAEGQVTTAKILSAIGGSPNQGDVIKYASGSPGSLVFSADLQGTGGMGGGSGGLIHHFLSQVDYDALTLVDDTVYLIRPGPSVIYAGAGGMGVQSDWASTDTGDAAFILNKPIIANSIKLVSNLPPPASATRWQLYGHVVIPNVQNPASSLHYLRKGTSGQFRVRMDNASTAGTYTARGYAGADNSPYYGETDASAIYPDAARTEGVEAVVYSTTTASGRAQWRVRTATALAEGTSVTDFIWLAARVSGAQWSEVQLFWSPASSEWASAEYATDPLSTVLHGTYDVVLSEDNGRVRALAIVTTNQMAQLTDGDSLGIRQAEIYTYLQGQINAVGGMATPSTVDIAAIITAMGGSPQSGQVIKYESVGPTLGWGDDIVGTGGGTTYTPTVASIYPIVKQIVVSVTGAGGVTFTANDMAEHLTGAVTIPPFLLSSVTGEANPNALANTDRLLIADASSSLENRYITAATAANFFQIATSGLDTAGDAVSIPATSGIDFAGAGVTLAAAATALTATIPGYTDAQAIAAIAASYYTKTLADARFVNVSGDTMTSTLFVTPATNAVALFLDATALTTQTPFVFSMNPSGNQQAFWIRRGADAQAFFTLDGNIGGGNANPGIALGPGGTATRDVELYRGGANILETPDAFVAATLGLGTGTINGQDAAQRLATTQANLGIVVGITEAAADLRYVNVDGDTMTGSLIIGRPVDGNAPTLNIVGAFSRPTATSPGIVDITGPINTAANQAALTIRRHNDTVDYFHVTGDVGGGTDDRPGFLLGVGGTTFHDVNLYRSSAERAENG